MRFKTILLIGAILLGTALAVPHRAVAIPAFTRLFDQSCNSCHTAFPRLNQAGEEFRLSGYTRFEGGTTTPSAKAFKLWSLTLPGIFPASVAGSAGFDFHNIRERERETGDVSVHHAGRLNLNEVEVLAGAPFGHHFSFILDYPIAETEFEENKFKTEPASVPGLLAVSFNNLLTDDLLNVKVGAYELPVGFSPEHRRLTIAPYEIYETTAQDLLGLEEPDARGIGNEKKIFNLAEPQLLAELYGTVYGERTGGTGLSFRYHVGISNDTNVHFDNNHSKSVYTRLEATYRGQTAGFFMLYSHDILDLPRVTGFPGRRDRVVRFGPDVSLRFFDERLILSFQHLWARDGDPTGVGVPFHYSGGFAEADYLFNVKQWNFVPLARFDYVRGNRFDNTLETSANPLMPEPIRTKPRVLAYTVGFQVLPWENVKIAPEFTYRVMDEGLSRSRSTVETDRARDFMGSIQVKLAF